MFTTSMSQKTLSLLEIRKLNTQRANTQSIECLRIAGIIMDDIATHIFYCRDIKVTPTIWGGKPGFIFESNERSPSDNLIKFWNALSQIRLEEGIQADRDDENRAVAFYALDQIPHFIDLFFSQNLNKWPLSNPNEKFEIKKVKDISPQDLILLKRDSYLGIEDLEREFREAQELKSKNLLMDFRYLPHDLHRSLNAVKYAAQGIKKYPTCAVFRLQ